MHSNVHSASVPAAHMPAGVSVPSREQQEKKNSVWRKLGGGSLSFSIIVHAVLLALGVFWIFQVIPEKKADVDFMPKGGGGGSPGVKEISNKKQRASMTLPNAPRMAAKGATSSFVLPEPDASASMSSVGSLSSGGLSGGLGGSGSGGGRGDGQGKGFGNGMGPGLGGGGGNMSPFGMIDPNANALVGTFYDLKQDAKGRPTPLGELSDWGQIMDKTREILHGFVSRGWNERSLAGSYYQAPQKLSQNKIYMPVLPADTAPKAFNCDVPGSRWVVVYRGMVRPPKTGKYRFVGAGDDVVAVRFNNKNVFDYGYESPTANVKLAYKAAQLTGESEDREFERARRDLAMPKPMPIYSYGSMSQRAKSDLRGLGVGLEFEAREGTDYPIEILVSEVPGGFFFAYLLIEEIGATYEKDPSGAPILPLFRLDNSPAAAGEGPPYDKNGPVWKISGKTRADI
ncbi:MAG: PA14 domain-containing protein [Luteolibacter sp.]